MTTIGRDLWADVAAHEQTITRLETTIDDLRTHMARKERYYDQQIAHLLQFCVEVLRHGVVVEHCFTAINNRLQALEHPDR